jgi:hypothetical protein
METLTAPPYTTVASVDSIEETVAALQANNFEPEVLDTKEEALARIKELITPGASVMNGSSKTLEAIGFVDYLKAGTHGWNNLHDAILAEKDPTKQAGLRKQSALSDFYLGSVHGLSQTGEMVIASNTGSQLTHLVYTSPNIILVVGAQKITPTLADAFKRLDTYVYPLENARIQSLYHVDTINTRTVILHKENPMAGRHVHVLIVKEPLGF